MCKKTCIACNNEKKLGEFVKCKKAVDGTLNTCKTCRNIKQREWRKANKELYNKTRLTWYHEKKGKEISNEACKKWRSNNPEYQKQWYDSNKEKFAVYVKNWASRNKGSINSSNQKRRAALLNAIPRWITSDDMELITFIYDICVETSKERGVKYHVDHIIPLQGKQVCGLHVPSNLRIITATENLKKGNKFTGNFL